MKMGQIMLIVTMSSWRWRWRWRTRWLEYRGYTSYRSLRKRSNRNDKVR